MGSRDEDTCISFWVGERHYSASCSPPSSAKDACLSHMPNTFTISQHQLKAQPITASTPSSKPHLYLIRSKIPNVLLYIRYMESLWLWSMLGQNSSLSGACVTCFQNTRVLDLNHSYRYSPSKRDKLEGRKARNKSTSLSNFKIH